MPGPGGLAKAVKQLAARPSIDYLVCPYEIMGVIPVNSYLHPTGIEMITYQDRMWRNKPSIRFYLPLHERLTGRGTLPNGQANWLLTAAGLRFRDWRDSAGLGVRIKHRNFKVLLAEQERLVARGEQLDPTSLYDLGCEAIHADPGFALDILGQVPGAISSCPGREGAWHEMESQWNKDMARAHLACGNRVTKLRRQRVRQNLQAFVEGKFWCAVLGHLAGFFAVARAENLAFDQRAVIVLQRLSLGNACGRESWCGSPA